MFSTDSFYNITTPPRGSTKKEFLHRLKKRKKVEERAEMYKASPLSDLQRYVKIFSERKFWKWFSRQQEALDYCSRMREDCLRLFAYEKSDGKRRFLVTTVKQFWNKYATMGEKDKHFYEVVALHHTCRLYFDVEYEKGLNVGLNGIAVLDAFIQYVCHCIYLEYKIHCNRKHVVDLDSSTETKFSRHLIFHLDGAVFIDNVSAGLFVKDLCLCLKLYIESGNKNKFLPVQDLEAKERAATTAGYTKTDPATTKISTTAATTTAATECATIKANTNALAIESQSAKSGPVTASTPSASTETACITQETIEALSSSSISDDGEPHWVKDLNSILVESTNGRTFLCDLAVYTKHRNFRLYQSSKVSKNVPLVVAKENEYEFTEKLTRIERNNYRNRGEVFDAAFRKFTDTLICDTQRNVRVLSYGDGCVSEKRSLPRPLKEGSQSSPYPDLDAFVMRHVKRFCNRGVIRRWLLFDHSKILVYDIDDNHWCGNINREHKSNHVYYIADLKFKVLYQKCFDPDCVRYRSPDTPIPDGVNPVVEDLVIQEFDVSCDAELNRLFSDDITVDGLDPSINFHDDALNCSYKNNCNKNSSSSNDNNNSNNNGNNANSSSSNNISNASGCSSCNDSGLNDMSNEELSLVFSDDMEMEMMNLAANQDDLHKQHTDRLVCTASTGLPSNNELIRNSDGVDGVDFNEFFQDDVFDIDKLCSSGYKESTEGNYPAAGHINNLVVQGEESNTSMAAQCVAKKQNSKIPPDTLSDLKHNEDDSSCDLFADDQDISNRSSNTKEDSDVISDAELSKLFDDECHEILVPSRDSECLGVGAVAVQQNNLVLGHNSNKENRAMGSYDHKKCCKHDSNDKFNYSEDLSSFFVDMTPLKQKSDNIVIFDESGADLFSPSSSPPLVSTRRRPSRKCCKIRTTLACPSFSGDKSIAGGRESKGKGVEDRSELDSRTLNRIFSGENPDNEFSLIL